MAIRKYGEEIPAGSHGDVVKINDITQTIREFIRCGTICTIDGKFIYFGGEHMLGSVDRPLTNPE